LADSVEVLITHLDSGRRSEGNGGFDFFLMNLAPATSNSQRIGYVRVSSADQNTARQLEGVELDRVFTDHLSGKGMARSQLEAMLAFVRGGDTLLVHSMDRLAPNLDDLRHLVALLTGRDVRVEFIKESLSFSGEASPMAQLLLSVMGAFAEFERALIREGIALAKAAGKYKGRKKSLSPQQVQEAEGLIEEGVSKARIARDLGVSRETLYVALRGVALREAALREAATSSAIPTRKAARPVVLAVVLRA